MGGYVFLGPGVTYSSHFSSEPQSVLSGSCALRQQTFLCSPVQALCSLYWEGQCFGSFIGVTSSPWCGKL